MREEREELTRLRKEVRELRLIKEDAIPGRRRAVGPIQDGGNHAPPWPHAGAITAHGEPKSFVGLEDSEGPGRSRMANHLRLSSACCEPAVFLVPEAGA